MAIRPNAGTMRGVRAVRDPEGILLDTFEDPIIGKIGYVIVHGEGYPAVYDGETWHPILNVEEAEWDSSVETIVAEQGQKLLEAAQKNPIYQQLAAQMFAGATTAAATTTADSTNTGGDPVTYYGA